MTKTKTLIATCCVAVLATPLVIFACDKDKSAGCSESQRTVLSVNSDKASSCNKATGKVANVLTAAASDCESGCPKQRTVNFLMRSLKGGCGDSCASKTDVVAALRTMATYEKNLICEKSVDQLAGVANVRTTNGIVATGCNAGKNQVVRAPLSDCAGKSDAAATVLSVGKGSGCNSSKGVATIVNAKGSECSSSKGVATIVNSKGSECSSSKGVATIVNSKGSECSSSKGVASIVNSKGSECSSSKGVATIVNSKGSECSSSKGVATIVNSKGSECSSSKGVATIVNSKGSECSSSKGVATIVNSKGSECSSSKGVASIVNSKGSECSSSKGVATIVNSKGSGCCASKSNAQVASVTTTTAGTCDGSSKYVAYGCDKSDRVARAAAKAYLAMMSELKDMNATDSCSLEAAQQVLATVMADMKRPNTEVAAVSFGAVSDVKNVKSGSGCCASKK